MSFAASARIAALPRLWPDSELLLEAPAVARPLTPFIGRVHECAEISALLREPHARLMTLTGPGGVGKTRLALETAERAGPDFPGGIVIVPLAAIVDAGFVLPAIAAAIGLGDGGEGVFAARVGAALSRWRGLLVLDNFEQILAAAPLVTDLLRAAPGMKVLITSRAPLRVEGEREYAVAPLALPRAGAPVSSATLAASDAGALFLQRAQSVDAHFQITAANAATVTEICRKLDGLPLALELAAARIKVLPLRSLLSRLDRQLDILVDGPQDRPERQRTMRDAIAWSYGLLDPDHQALFRQLSIFRGGFSLDVAERILGAEASVTGSGPTPPRSPDILARIAALVDQSLVTRQDDGQDEPRFQMLETIREFGWEQLVGRGEENAAFLRLAQHWQAYAEAAWRSAGRAEAVGPMLITLETSHDNVRAALDWLEAHDPPSAFRLAGGLFWFWYLNGHHAEAWRRFSRLLSAPAPAVSAETLARTLVSAGAFAHFQKQTREATPLLERALSEWRALADAWGIGFSLLMLGIVAEDGSSYARATSLFNEAIVHFTAAGDRSAAATATYHLAVVAFGAGEFETAQARLADVLAAGSGASARAIAWAIHIRGLISYEQRHDRAALRDLQASLRLYTEARTPAGVPEGLVGVGVTITRFDASLGVSLWAAGERLKRERGDAFQVPKRALYDAAIGQARAQQGDAAFLEAQRRGLSWTEDEAITIALDYAPPAPTRVAPQIATFAGISPREADVLRAVAAGNTNEQTAELLFMSPRTVQTHLTAIYRKLNVANRAQAVRIALERGLA